MAEKLHICLIAGEASGDSLGARLMVALKREQRQIVFSGVGGRLMTEQGLTSLFPMSDLSVMGLAEVLPRIPLLRRHIKQVVGHIRKEQPDIVVTIDSPDFCFRVARELKSPPDRTFRETLAAYASGHEDFPSFRMPRMIHYVAPTVWAWRPGRAKKMAALYDGVICLFPFEPPWFEEQGIKAVFAGHPAVEAFGQDKNKGNLRKDLEIPDDARVLGLLFGSRMGELNRTAPVLREAAYRYAENNPAIHIVTLTLPQMEREVRNLLNGFPCKTHVVTDQGRKQECFATMDAALATSGTVGLELAVAGVPHAIGYRMNPLSWALIRRRLTVRFAHLVNILFEEGIVPEFIQDDCRVEGILPALETLMSDDVARARQRIMFDKFREETGAPAGMSSSQLAAEFIIGQSPAITSSCSSAHKGGR